MPNFSYNIMKKKRKHEKEKKNYKYKIMTPKIDFVVKPVTKWSAF